MLRFASVIIRFPFLTFGFCSETGLGKAIDAAAKGRECEALKLWRPDVVNHLYKHAASTPNGDLDAMKPKQQSMVSHIQDINEHNTPVGPCCTHPPRKEEA